MTVCVDVALTPAELPSALDARSVAVVIDVVRATSVVATALAAGCDGVLPVAEVDEARRVAASRGALLVGERGGLPPQGFDLGNSPSDFTRERVGGRPIVLTTTNGTAAVRRCAGAAAILAAAFVNAEATCRALARMLGDAPEPGDEERPVGPDPSPGAPRLADVERILLVCAGSGGVLCADDVAAAGCLAGSLALQLGTEPTDATRTAAALFDAWRHDVHGLLVRSLSGRKLAAVGLARDLADCARVDAVPVAVLLDEGGVFRKLTS